MVNNKNQRTKVAAYCRVSTDKDDQLMSLKAQQEFFEDYVHRNNLELYKLYTDEGISGTKLKNRKAFNEMLKDAENGCFECVYVKDVSRFARNAVDFLTSIRTLKNMGIKCQFVTANLSTEDGELTLGILALVAQEESANLSKRVKFGKQKNAQNGKVPNFIYGYDKTIGDNFNLTINSFEASVIRRIYHMYITDGYGANKIAQTLNKQGIKTKRGCNWSQNAICRILTNRIYLGEIINGKEYVKDYLTGTREKRPLEDCYHTHNSDLIIIDTYDFDEAQKILCQRSKSFKLDKERQSNKYPLSTLIKCDCCGYSFRRIYRKWVNEYIKWECSNRNSNGVGICENTTKVDERQLLAEIVSYLKSLSLNQDKLLEQVTAEFKRKFNTENKQLDEKLLRKELDKLKRAKNKQTQMFEADIITLEELKTRTKDLNAAIALHESQLTSLLSECSYENKIEGLVRDYCSDIDKIISQDTLDNASLKRLIDKIVVSKDGEIKVYLKVFSDLKLSNKISI